MNSEKPDSERQVDAVVGRLTLKQESKLKDKLKQRGWKPTHYLEGDNWISPHSLIEYSFESALRIEDLRSA